MSWKRRLLEMGVEEAEDLLRSLSVRKRIRTDNPGGEWLRRQQQRAAEEPMRATGPTTAWLTRPAMVSPYRLHAMRGENFEKRMPGEAQYDRLLPKIEAEGFRPDSPILIGVNYQGVPRIIEGNTRAAVARDLGVKRIPAEVRWYAGGEQAPVRPGTLVPSNLAEELYDPDGFYQRWYRKRLAVKKARGGLAIKRKGER